MEDNGKKVIQMSLSSFVILVILLIVILGLGVGLYINAFKKSNTDTEIQEVNGNETANVLDENITIGVRYNKDFEDMFVEYILSSIKEYAKNGSILKSTTGDITAEQLTIEEVNSNSKKYREKIIEMLTNKEIFGEIYKVNNKDACKYKLEKILNNLGLGTHMGTGTGKTDESGNKVYVYGMMEIDTTTPSSEDKKHTEQDKNFSSSNEEVKYPTSLGAIFSYTNSQINSSVSNKTSDITYVGEPLKSNSYKISDDRKSITISDKTLNFGTEIYHACVYPIEQGGTDMWAILFRDGTVKYTIDYGKTVRDGGNHIIDIFPIQYKRNTGDEMGSIIGSTILVANEYGALTDLRIK